MQGCIQGATGGGIPGEQAQTFLSPPPRSTLKCSGARSHQGRWGQGLGGVAVPQGLLSLATTREMRGPVKVPFEGCGNALRQTSPS